MKSNSQQKDLPIQKIQQNIKKDDKQEQKIVSSCVRNEQSSPVNEQKLQQLALSIFCQICKDFIVHSMTTSCEHTFCELCLSDYMIYIDQCPSCKQKIRCQRLSSNILLDNLIMDYITKYQPNQLQDFKHRLDQYKKHHKDKKLTQFQAGVRIDVRDADYVWCSGRILRTINKIQEKKIKCIIVKYNNKKQQFSENSPRIATLGFYTQRQNIPKYLKGKLVIESKDDNTIYTVQNDHQEEKQQQQQNTQKNQ